MMILAMLVQLAPMDGLIAVVAMCFLLGGLAACVVWDRTHDGR